MDTVLYDIISGMEVPHDPRRKAVRTNIKRCTLNRMDKGVFVCTAIMIADDELLIGCHGLQIVLQPQELIFRRISGGLVALADRQENKMELPQIEAAPGRAVKALKQLLAVIAFGKIVIADAVAHRAAYQFVGAFFGMALGTFHCKEVTGVQKESRLMQLDLLCQKVHPIQLLSSIDLRIGNMKEAKILLLRSRGEGEIINACLPVGTDEPILPVPGQNTHVQHTAALPAGQGIAAFRIRQNHISAVTDPDTSKGKTSFIGHFSCVEHSTPPAFFTNIAWRKRNCNQFHRRFPGEKGVFCA